MDSNVINNGQAFLNNPNKANIIKEEQFFQTWQKQLESARWWLSDSPENNNNSATYKNSAYTNNRNDNSNYKVEGSIIDQGNNKTADVINVKTTSSTEHSPPQFIRQLIENNSAMNKYIFDKTLFLSKQQITGKENVKYLDKFQENFSAYNFKSSNDNELRIYVSHNEDGIKINIIGNKTYLGSAHELIEQITKLNKQNKKVVSLKVNGELVYEDKTHINTNELNKNLTELNKLY
jgi:hypothetical protein